MKNPIDKKLTEIIQDIRLDKMEKLVTVVEKEDDMPNKVPPRPEPELSWYTDV